MTIFGTNINIRILQSEIHVGMTEECCAEGRGAAPSYTYDQVTYLITPQIYMFYTSNYSGRCALQNKHIFEKSIFF